MQKKSSTLRIIGGKWRSRKIDFLSLKGVRPTTDIVRETLFNWLTPIIAGANCLDLFAGSGALSFEALSRGAAHAVMVDASVKIIGQLKANAKLLGADSAEFYVAKIPEQLGKIPQQPFDVVFIDPPFNHDLVGPTCNGLVEQNLLTKDAYVYIEAEKSLDINAVIPGSWRILHDKCSGATRFSLLRVDPI